MKRPLFLILLSSVSLLVSGCSLFESAPAAQDAQQKAPGSISESDVAVDSRVTSATRHSTVDGIEVTWEVPSEETDGFIIRYGSDPTRMNSEVSVKNAELRREDDSQYGPVYRYVIVGVPSGKSLFVSIAARRGEFLSNFSPPIAESRAAAAEY